MSVYVASTIYGFVYPAYTSYVVIEENDAEQFVQWNMYWIIRMLLYLFETMADTISLRIPIYEEAKFILILWLTLPQFQGARKIHDRFLSRYLQQYEAEIDHRLEDVRRLAKSKAEELAATGVQQIKTHGTTLLSMSHQWLVEGKAKTTRPSAGKTFFAIDEKSDQEEGEETRGAQRTASDSEGRLRRRARTDGDRDK